MIGEKISIITVSFNSEKTIENTFQSVLNQKYRPLEYIIVDGKSTDGTIKIIKKYLPIFLAAGIEVNYKSEKDKGISDAFNKGIARATGDIIGIINSDDCIAENILCTIAEKFSETDDVLCGDCLWRDVKKNSQYVRKSHMKLKKLKHEMVLMHPTCFVRKKAYETYGVFDINLKFCMDKDLMARFYRKGVKFKYIPQIIAIMSAGGTSDVNYRGVFDEGQVVALRNGVPYFCAVIYKYYKIIRIKLVKYYQKTKKIDY